MISMTKLQEAHDRAQLSNFTHAFRPTHATLTDSHAYDSLSDQNTIEMHYSSVPQVYAPSRYTAVEYGYPTFSHSSNDIQSVQRFGFRSSLAHALDERPPAFAERCGSGRHVNCTASMLHYSGPVPSIAHEKKLLSGRFCSTFVGADPQPMCHGVYNGLPDVERSELEIVHSTPFLHDTAYQNDTESSYLNGEMICPMRMGEEVNPYRSYTLAGAITTTEDQRQLDQQHNTDSDSRCPGDTNTNGSHLDERQGGGQARGPSAFDRSPSLLPLRRSPHAKRPAKAQRSHSTPTPTIDHTDKIQSKPTGRPGQNVIKLLQNVKPKKHTVVACLFCRARKIACKPPAPADQDRRCSQCRLRELDDCVFPKQTRRGRYKRLSSTSRQGVKTSIGEQPTMEPHSD